MDYHPSIISFIVYQNDDDILVLTPVGEHTYNIHSSDSNLPVSHINNVMLLYKLIHF